MARSKERLTVRSKVRVRGEADSKKNRRREVESEWEEERLREWIKLVVGERGARKME